jgi:hypothetical protein
MSRRVIQTKRVSTNEGLFIRLFARRRERATHVMKSATLTKREIKKRTITEGIYPAATSKMSFAR